MNKQTFLRNLNKLKKYSWHLTKDGSIRTRHKNTHCPCPIIVMYWHRTGKWVSTSDALLKLDLINTDWGGTPPEFPTIAADHPNKKYKLRQSMLKILGLPLDK